MTWFRNMSLSKKLFGGFGVVLAFLVVIVAVGYSGLNTLSSSAQKVSKIELSQAGAVADVRAAVSDMHFSQSQYVMTNGSTRQNFLDDRATFDKALAHLRTVITAPAQRQAVARLAAAYSTFNAVDAKVYAALRQGDRAAAAALVNGAGNDAADTINAAGRNIQVQNSSGSAPLMRSFNATVSSTKTLTLVLAIVALLLGGSIAFFISRHVTGGVKALIARMAELEKAFKGRLVPGLQALAGGDLTIKLVAGTKGASGFAKDELGQAMAQAEHFRAALLECYEAYNMTVGNLRSLIGQVTSTAGSVGAASKEMSSTSEEAGKASGEIAQAIGDMAQGAERQVQMVETALQTAAEVAGAVKESAEQAEQTAEAASQARAAAQHGVESAEQANEAMRSVRDSSQEVTRAIGELSAKSEQIGAIVETITGIAEQTNLLALNAAIEAARAGDQGRGFAVVADEVRKLAEESQNAAHEISQLVGVIQDETRTAVRVVEDGAKRTEDGVAVVEQTREAFLTIGQAVDDMTARIEQIAAGAQQITASASSMQEGMAEIESVAEESSASTEQVSASTEETSASAQEIAASAHELATNAEQLNQLVGHFQIGEGGSNSVSEVLHTALEAHKAWDARLREAIKTGSSATTPEQAGVDDQCAFGKWLHSPGEFRTSQPEAWQQIHDLHEQFHRNAAGVLKLAIAGKRREAEERVGASDFVNVQRQLMDALQTAIAA